MSKQIDGHRSLQTQQMEEIRKELGSEITALKPIIEKYFANAPPLNQCEGKQTESTSELTRECLHKQIRPTAPIQNTVLQKQLTRASTTITTHLSPTDYRLDWKNRIPYVRRFGTSRMDLSLRTVLLNWQYTARVEGSPRLFSHDRQSTPTASFLSRHDDPLMELVSLKQGNDSIDVYLGKFDCAMTRITLAPGHA